MYPKKKIFLMTNNMSLKIICNEKRELPITVKKMVIIKIPNDF